MMTWAAAKGPMLVEIRNTPFQETRAATRDAVLAALGLPITSHPLCFTTDPQDAAEPNIRVVIAFHPCVNLTPSALLRGQLRVMPHDSRLSILVVFASGNDVLASVEGRMDGLSSITGQGFPALLRQAMSDLFGAPS